MTHTPPVPAGNQSPYPLQEPPHPPRPDRPPVAKRGDGDGEGGRGGLVAGLALAGTALVVGVGAAAAYLFTRNDAAAGKRRPGRKTAAKRGGPKRKSA